MPSPEQPWNDTRVENAIGVLLRVGVLTSAGLVLLGGIWYLLHHAGDRAAYGIFRAEPDAYRSVTGVLRGLGAWQGRGIIQFGVLLLIATPILRVGFSVWAFARERDWTYVWITLVVLAILLYSFAGGHL